MKKILFAAVAAMIALSFAACGSTKKAVPSQVINLSLVSTPQTNKYANLEYGIRLNVQDARANNRLIQVYDASATQLPSVSVNPGIMSFIPESARRYMRTLGFNLDADIATDYLMQLNVKEFHVDYLYGVGWTGTVIMSVEVRDHNRTLVYPNVEVSGRASVNGSSTSLLAANTAINKAYANALEDIDWDRIAFFLHRANNPKDEASKKVQGEGNTALEHLVIHWNVNSRPQGADIYWRVISQTPLTYNNSGLVQIEVKVEKTGYYSQTKKYDVRSLIDENDVSYMFRLVPENE